MRRVGHQHAIAAGEAEIGGQRRALVAAFFLDHLHQQHLAALDDVLDLVAAAQRLALLAQFVGGAFVDRRASRAGADLVVAGGVVRLVAVVGLAFEAVIGVEIVAAGAPVVVMPVVVIIVAMFGGAQPVFLGGVLGLFGQQRVAIGLGDLVIIGVNFAEREEAMAIAAIFDERRLQRRLDPGHLGEIDISLELFVLGGFEIEFLDPVTFGDRDPGFLRVARVDQHAHGHGYFSGARAIWFAGAQYDGPVRAQVRVAGRRWMRKMPLLQGPARSGPGRTYRRARQRAVGRSSQASCSVNLEGRDDQSRVAAASWSGSTGPIATSTATAAPQWLVDGANGAGG